MDDGCCRGYAMLADEVPGSLATTSKLRMMYIVNWLVAEKKAVSYIHAYVWPGGNRRNGDGGCSGWQARTLRRR